VDSNPYKSESNAYRGSNQANTEESTIHDQSARQKNSQLSPGVDKPMLWRGNSQDSERTRALIWEKEKRAKKARQSLDNQSPKKVPYKDYLKELRLQNRDLPSLDYYPREHRNSQTSSVARSIEAQNRKTVEEQTEAVQRRIRDIDNRLKMKAKRYARGDYEEEEDSEVDKYLVANIKNKLKLIDNLT